MWYSNKLVENEIKYGKYSPNEGDSFIYSWVVILLSLSFVFPIGLYLLYKKIQLHRRNIFLCGGLLTVLGFGLIIINSFIFIIDLSVNQYTSMKELSNSSISIEILLLLLSIVILILGIKLKIKANKYKKCMQLIYNYHITDINKIAKELNISTDYTLKLLDKLIEKKYLDRIVVNLEELKIILPISTEEKEKKKKELEYSREVTCPNCGANNYVNQKVGICEYCKSYIQ